jgi:hypothetical protein
MPFRRSGISLSFHSTSLHPACDITRCLDDGFSI